MSVEEEEAPDTFTQEDHQVAFIFDPEKSEDVKRERPSKRRRVARKTSKLDEEDEDESDEASLFVSLLNGTESPECVQLRQRLFQESWGMIDARIQGILRDSNSATLDQVSSFVTQAVSECGDRIPSAFIITGPNIASQDLLFEQLSETLQSASPSKFVRLRSSEAVNLKAALKKIIRDATSQTSEDDGEDDLQVGQGQDGRRYLDYDLEALEAFIRPQSCDHVFVAFQDSEAFDSSLLSDLISLFSSWRPRIPFTLLFGIATSVELLQARLLKSACRLVYGAQFDCVQTETILESVFKGAVASGDVPLRLGSLLLRGMLDRQHDQVAGIQAFISSLKYAYMCHFFANPLSILLAPDTGHGNVLQVEHFEAMRNLPSVRSCVEEAVELGTMESLGHAKSLVEDDAYLLARVQASGLHRQQWIDDRLRSLLVAEAAGATHPKFSRAYAEAMAKALPESGSSSLAESVRRMSADSLVEMLCRVICVFKDGEPSLRLGPATGDRDLQVLGLVEENLARLQQLKVEAENAGITLRSKYSGQSKVMRTTVIAQRVQLSRDSAALREEDKQLTEMVDAVVEALTGHFGEFRTLGNVLLSEGWVYDSKAPLRDVMVPRPRAAFERSLTRPHDYLSCTCCSGDGEDGGVGGGGGIRATLPATSILYHLYLEAGNLINVADMWSAFSALVGEDGEKDKGNGDGDGDGDGDEGDDGNGNDGKGNERQMLVMFYRGLAELRALGFVKASKKKTDHIAKVRWL
ncbi:Origin recognition complex subunit 3-like protein [Cladobotryum mycophilum]|uniref:Origin recognition complex subunit 3-like protein n=1 Tax=Cladobotryum mycophilum TaxID=491253 RepID=A0ABR0S6J4_9HYPO